MKRLNSGIRVLMSSAALHSFAGRACAAAGIATWTGIVCAERRRHGGQPTQSVVSHPYRQVGGNLLTEPLKAGQTLRMTEVMAARRHPNALPPFVTRQQKFRKNVSIKPFTD
jgi:hypothetical protein